MIDYKQLNGLTLAYMGDSVFEQYVRQHLISLGLTKVNQLHKEATKYTSGAAQAGFMQYLLNNDLLTEEEIGIFKRGRNSHAHTARKNIDLQIYMIATGFEALIGYLYLTNNSVRLEQIIDLRLKWEEDTNELK